MNAIANPVRSKPHANGSAPQLLPDPYAEGDGDRLFEVVNGRRVEKTMGLVQTTIAGILYRAIANYCDERNIGHAVVESMFTIPGSANDRKPDIAVVSYEKWPKDRPIPDANAWAVAPDLVVEVISPTDRAFDVFEKMEEYFAGGVRQVWQIYSNVGMVLIFSSPNVVSAVSRNDELAGSPILPGFKLPVTRLFPLWEPRRQD